MHFYSHLISILFPFVVLDNKDDLPPVGTEYVVTYTGAQVVTYQGDLLIAKED